VYGYYKYDQKILPAVLTSNVLMCTKGRASLVIEAEAEEEGTKAGGQSLR